MEGYLGAGGTKTPNAAPGIKRAAAYDGPPPPAPPPEVVEGRVQDAVAGSMFALYGLPPPPPGKYRGYMEALRGAMDSLPPGKRPTPVGVSNRPGV